jgi:predicted pyridoxine 5'-phosphate oxidase superfamily flavin-nucleotide-binding protein
MQSPFHSGELEIQRQAGTLDEAATVGRIIGRTIPLSTTRFLRRQRLAVATTRDVEGHVWVSPLTGKAGFISIIDETLLRLNTSGVRGDLLVSNLETHSEIGLLVIDIETRRRVRFNRRGLMSEEGVFVMVNQVYGNCPKYIQRRLLLADDERRTPPVATASASTSLDAAQRRWIEGADTLFIGSHHSTGGADASHRGGLPGFVRVAPDNRVSFEDYPGNGMFNTLGNLAETPEAALLFIDFSKGDILQLSGRARLHAKRSLSFEVEQVREIRNALTLRARLVEHSPAIPSRHIHACVASQDRKPAAPAEEESR